MRVGTTYQSSPAPRTCLTPSWLIVEQYGVFVPRWRGQLITHEELGSVFGMVWTRRRCRWCGQAVVGVEGVEDAEETREEATASPSPVKRNPVVVSSEARRIGARVVVVKGGAEQEQGCDLKRHGQAIGQA